MQSPKAAPAQGAAAAEITALAEQEQALAEQELAILGKSAEAEVASRSITAKLDEIRGSLQKYAGSAAHADAETAFNTSYGISVPPHQASQQSADALEARRKAIAARQQAVQVEFMAIKQREEQLQRAQAAVEALKGDLAKIEKKVKDDEAARAAALRAAQEQSAAQATAQAMAQAAAVAPPAAPVTPATPAPIELPKAKAAPQPPVEAKPKAAPVPPPKKSSGIENRRASRVRMETEVSLASDSNFFSGFTSDLSESGVFVATYGRLLSPGTEVELSLALPGSPAMQVKGVVKWIREPRNANDQVFPGMGIAFQELNPQASGLISHFMKERDPLFWAD